MWIIDARATLIIFLFCFRNVGYNFPISKCVCGQNLVEIVLNLGF